MCKPQWDVVVLGGGPAGLAAALAAEKAGADSVLLVERDNRLGGILVQCIHPGFGLHRFGKELTGPEYAHLDIQQVSKGKIQSMLNTFVLQISSQENHIDIRLMRTGIVETITTRSVVLAMGCRERTAGAISLAGPRPAGIYTAGAAQRLVNLQNILPGKNVVIAGSGDIGLIMARRMSLEGAKVHAVTEILPYAGGLARNLNQCLADFNIPLLLSTKVVHVYGQHRLEGVRIAPLNPQGTVIADAYQDIPCDTLLLSVGLIPENELSRRAGILMDSTTGGPLVDELCMTSVPGVFACGNALHVHDVADYVSEEADVAGKSAARFARCGHDPQELIPVSHGPQLRYALPQKIAPGSTTTLSFRVAKPLGRCQVEILQGGKRLYHKNHLRLIPSEMIRVSVEFHTAGAVEVLCEERP